MYLHVRVISLFHFIYGFMSPNEILLTLHGTLATVIHCAAIYMIYISISYM